MALRIQKLSTTNGFLEQSPIEFADGLTCIIGARGTCKSTIVESIRFAFNYGNERIDRITAKPERRGVQDGEMATGGMIRATLGTGSVRCEIINEKCEDDCEQITIERELDASARIYRDGVIEHTDNQMLERIEIYSQGELQQIAEQDKLRLELIDRPNKLRIDRLKAQREEIGKKITNLGEQIRNVRAAIDGHRNDLRTLADLENQLETVQQNRPTISAELDNHRQQFLKRRATFELLTEAVATRRNLVAAGLEAIGSWKELAAIVEQLAESGLTNITGVSTEIAKTAKSLEAMHNRLDEYNGIDLDAKLEGIRDDFEKANVTYYQLRREQQSLNENLRHEDKLKSEVAILHKRKEEMEALIARREKLVSERERQRNHLQKLGEDIFELRIGEVEKINNQHGASILLSLETGAQSSAYSAKVAELLQGSRIRAQDDVAKELAQHLAPADLINIVEAGDSKRLASILTRDVGQMARVVSHLMDHSALHSIEGFPFEDRLEITMYDRGTPKSVNGLSKGQKATALLPLILRDADYPLIFDQPEDDLDNSFIYDTLVSRIQELKTKRQLIFVTHNANIPVLGEADKVIVMRMASPTRADTPSTGSIDQLKQDILTFLEGGAEAFRRRHAQYEGLLDE